MGLREIDEVVFLYFAACFLDNTLVPLDESIAHWWIVPGVSRSLEFVLNMHKRHKFSYKRFRKVTVERAKVTPVPTTTVMPNWSTNGTCSKIELLGDVNRAHRTSNSVSKALQGTGDDFLGDISFTSFDGCSTKYLKCFNGMKISKRRNACTKKHV
ncbi:hypothetical protein CEXT_635271 [Caerostris extrusa]|uniref:Uncharacterized protein n=1 Tax=Caerostris extrusa TaxID=172846 RepID=A0AAV4U1Z7_CAEEX|nr:hypothetical protein CEXT_635271 [Caerostris extrusa]